MQTVVFSKAQAFLDDAEEYLLNNEAENNLILGLAYRLIDSPLTYGTTPFFAVVKDVRTIRLAALCTPPYNLTIAHNPDEVALGDLVRVVRSHLQHVPGVNGTGATPELFSALWTKRHRSSATCLRRERIYRLDTVANVAQPAGSVRRATTEDKALLFEWLLAFNDEALDGDHRDGVEKLLEQRLTTPADSVLGYYLWELDEPVALASIGSSTPHGLRIGPVWTPLEHRRHGYATALVAAVSTIGLTFGKQWCFLYTDLDNPTSNAIYQTIGYRPICDAENWVFTP